MTEKDFYLIGQLQRSIGIMEIQYPPKTFFTAHMIVKFCLLTFLDIEEPKWALRSLIKRPHFRLDDVKGWRNDQLIEARI